MKPGERGRCKSVYGLYGCIPTDVSELYPAVARVDKYQTFIVISVVHPPDTCRYPDTWLYVLIDGTSTFGWIEQQSVVLA